LILEQPFAAKALNYCGLGFDICHNHIVLFNPYVTSGTYMSHLQRVFSSPLG